MPTQKNVFKRFSYTGTFLTALAIAGLVWLALSEQPPKSIYLSNNLVITGWHYKRLRDVSTNTMKPTAVAGALHNNITTYVLAAICHQQKFTISFGGLGHAWATLDDTGKQISAAYQIDDEKPVEISLIVSGKNLNHTRFSRYRDPWTSNMFDATENGGHGIFVGNQKKFIEDIVRAKRFRFSTSRSNGRKIETEFGTERAAKSIGRVMKSCSVSFD
jgi:hypothetical protein